MILPTLCDGFGMVILEALANGLPVITTSNAGGADAIVSGRSGFVIAPADRDAIVERLSWCDANPDTLFGMRRHALDRAGDWTWEGFRQRFRDSLETAGVAIRTAA
jgi:glycosyltransferase involved in cell wall biosynthesis